jgi:acetyl esterase/lipase
LCYLHYLILIHDALKPLTAMQEVLAIIARDREAAGISPDRLDVGAARAFLPPTLLSIPPGTTVKTVNVEGVECHWVVAPEANPKRRIAYLHGGGFVAGGFHSHRSLLGSLSQSAGCAILSIEYSLAPEAKYPTQVNEAKCVWEWLAGHGPWKDDAAEARFIAADSAGAAIAVAMMVSTRASGGALPDAAAFFCAMLDLNAETSSFVRSSQRLRDMVQAYVRDALDLTDPAACPMIAPLQGLPPMLLQTGSVDDARSDSERFVERAIEAGVDAKLVVWPNMFHVWHRFAPLLPEASAAIADAGSFLAAHRC